MFDILMYLFENYVQNDLEVDMLVDEDQLKKELVLAGFRQSEIIKALNWLEHLADLRDSEQPYLCSHEQHSFRVYTPEELERLDVECRGFLLFLEQIKVLNVEAREMVIDRVMDLDESSLTLDDLKWVVMMVLFNAPGQEMAYNQMENMMFDEQPGRLHS
ncbi:MULTISPECIES: DUF494 family protein [Shewanella]|jgi:Smg protein|uniref:Protein Smg homolog n=2 Tax=Shewanella TaxID=22 RepID=A0AAJ1BKG8_9GAMM|nr:MULTISPECIES: DUF494 family protein [Shewanella]AZQ12753.1 hypothetical protein STH12_03698 [Shewanella khirikhana]MCH4296545.1 DUF494 family protein [Shewanella zhuhaiensis]